MIFRTSEHTFDLSKRPLIMGIINITPDSFSDGGDYFNPQNALQQALQFEKQGADLLDLGAVSTRPDALQVSTEEELDRLRPVLDLFKNKVSIPISIDTTSHFVARFALEKGASIINDVSGFKDDSKLASVVKEFNSGVILMHRRGNAQNMQDLTEYEDVVAGVKEELKESLDLALNAGISKEYIAIDPGIGFAKTTEQNLELLNRLNEFMDLNYPVLIGTSRKSFIGKILNKEPKDRDFGTVATSVLAVQNGARILRVHNVEATVDAMRVCEAIEEPLSKIKK